MDGPRREDEHGGSDGTHRADLALFAVYCALYAGFMALVAFAPEVLAARVLGGVNLAVAYGMGLIVAAVVLAAVSTYLHRRRARG